jgi:hypothetical protein
VLLVLLVTLAACTSAGASRRKPEGPPAHLGPPAYRAFTPDSWWNSPVPADAPSNPRADGILEYMSTAPESGGGCLRLAGTSGNNWGQPVYWAEPGDPEYDVAVQIADEPPELHHLRIPKGAQAAPNNDSSMTVFDRDRGYVVALTDAVYDDGSDTWQASGATVTYLDSNGLHARTGESTDPRNLGSHRGNNGAVMMVRVDEVAAGRIDHVLKVASGPEASRRFVFPMVGSDGHARDRNAPPEGLRFRIKPSVDLTALNLDWEALVIAQALQKYGMYIGDSAGVTALKLEDTRFEGKGQEWHLSPTALCALPFTPEFWDVLPEGYEPPAPG